MLSNKKKIKSPAIEALEPYKKSPDYLLEQFDDDYDDELRSLSMKRNEYLYDEDIEGFEDL